MAVATARSVLARVSRGGYPASRPLLRAERNSTADTLGKRVLYGFKGRRYYSIWDKLPTSKLDPVSNLPMMFAFTFGMVTMIPLAISGYKTGKEDSKNFEELKAYNK